MNEDELRRGRKEAEENKERTEEKKRKKKSRILCLTAAFSFCLAAFFLVSSFSKISFFFSSASVTFEDKWMRRRDMI